MGKSSEQFLQMREDEVSQNLSFQHLLDAKKSNIATAVANISSIIKDGNYDSLKGLILAIKGKALFTDLEKELRPIAEEHYLNKIEKGYSTFEVKVDQSPTKTEYDYSVCKDIEYDALIVKKTNIDAEVKAKETFLKTLTKPLEVVDTETGETYTIYPPNKLQKDGLKITIK